jgi:NADPH:quinone reductase-like Zn-dependent oxidoreductase
MRAVALDALGTPPALREDLPAPTPAASEVLVRVHASSANPVDGAIAAGMLSGMFEHEFPVVLGRDYAGVVEQAGADVSRYAAGDEVYGFVPHAAPTVHDGSWAELIAVSEGASAPLPAGVDLTTAGAAALTGVTALLAVDALELSEGDAVLVVGAAGGVGSLAVQLAAHAGATVVAPALPEDEEYLRGLGVAELVARDGDVAAAVRERQPDGVDAVLDLVSYAPGAFDAALKADGRVASPNSAAGDGPGRTNVLAVSSTDNLERLAALLADGTLRVPIQDTHELAQAADALGALSASHTRGKLAIRVS